MLYGRHVWKGISYEYMWVCVDDAVSTCLCVCVPYPFYAVNLNYGLAGNNGRSCLIFLSTSVRLLGWLELWIVLLAWVGVRCCWVCVWLGGIILLLGFPAWCDRVCVWGLDWGLMLSNTWAALLINALSVFSYFKRNVALWLQSTLVW